MNKVDNGQIALEAKIAVGGGGHIAQWVDLQHRFNKPLIVLNKQCPSGS
ncbi:MAG: hypothetical protein WDN46_14155 [Methylocella sp.]